MFKPDKNDEHCKKNEYEERIERFQLPCDCHFLKIERKSLKYNGHIGLSHLVCKKDVNRESTCEDIISKCGHHNFKFSKRFIWLWSINWTYCSWLYVFKPKSPPFTIWREKVTTYLSDRKCFIINNIFARGIPIPDLIGNVQTHSDVVPRLCIWICSSSDLRQEGSLLQSKVAQIVHHNAWMPRQTTLMINSWGS